uniref:Aminotransferase-like plant mobile domain-containing protein n=1 Tax=Fagus sylvatica TaxID=28930 RepID=A0A2N9EFU2_FAGSY
MLLKIGVRAYHSGIRRFEALSLLACLEAAYASTEAAYAACKECTLFQMHTMSRTSKSRGSRSGSSSSNPTLTSNLLPPNAKLGAKKWVPVLAPREPITPFFRPREHISALLRPPHHEEEKVVYDRSNATEVRDWWKKLNVATKALVKLADSRPMVENLAGSWSLKCVLTGLNVSGRTIRFPEDGAPLDEIYLGYSTGSANISVPSLSLTSVLLNCVCEWLHFFEDLETIAKYNWSGLALAHLYVNMDSISRGSTTSLMGYWWIGLCAMGCARTSPRQTNTTITLPGTILIESLIIEKRWRRVLPLLDISLGSPSWPGLGDLENWQPFEGMIDAMTAFEDYQGTLMLPLQTTLPITEGGSKDIPLPPWSVTLHCSDGFLVETAANNANLKDMIGLVGSLKILATQQSEDAYLRSSRDDNDDDDGGGLHSAHHYHNVRLDLSMLRVAAEFWDPTRHVFHFNQCELCPMIEEFAALMNHTNLRNFEAMDPKIVDIVDLLGTNNPVPMILAETLNGLDNLKDGTCHHFKGKPSVASVGRVPDYPWGILPQFLWGYLTEDDGQDCKHLEECVIYTRQEGTKKTDPGSLYESWLICDMAASERDNKVRALRLAAKLGKFRGKWN